MGADFSGVEDTQTTTTEQQGGEQIVTEEKLHPAWEKAFAAIPADLRDTPMYKPLVDQIRESERNTRKAIDEARGQGVPDDWAAVIADAEENGLSVADLVEGFNSSNSMRQMIANDPDAFVESLEESIREAIKQGTITAREGSKLMKAGEAAAEEVNLETQTEDPRISALQKRLDEQDRANAEAQQQWEAEQEQQQIDADAEDAAAEFISVAEKAFVDNGLAERTGKTKQIIAQVAAQYMEDAPNATPQQAINQAIKDFQEQFGLPVTVGGKQTTRIPIGGGGNAVTVDEPQKFTSDKERTNAMIAEAQRLAGSDE